jgi:hypothetical protein
VTEVPKGLKTFRIERVKGVKILYNQCFVKVNKHLHHFTSESSTGPLYMKTPCLSDMRTTPNHTNIPFGSGGGKNNPQQRLIHHFLFIALPDPATK